MRILQTLCLLALATASFTFEVRADTAPVLEKCVVNGDKFSEHHRAPLSMSYEGRTIPVCCKSCARKFNKNPLKFIKAWDEAVKAKGGTASATTASK